jgi:dTDP-4-amino-4,6-dideoxygalactose transaminase
MREKLAIEGGTPARGREDFLVFGSPLIEEEQIGEVVKCLYSGWIGSGPKVNQFERNFADYKNCRFAVALNSGTAALHLAMLNSGVGLGDEVITTPMTFCATVNAIIHCGATPVLADCNRESMNISPLEIEKKITPRTKAILIVHFAGRCCEMDQIMALAEKYELLVIEDCVHAIESEYHGEKPVFSVESALRQNYEKYTK